MPPQQVRLRWTTHQGTLVAVLQSLLGKNCLVDVTLAAEGKYVRAHKVILCACSPYFEELLSISEDKHPIILLQDVKYVELQALISYMYWGEVNIDEENLPSLLRIADALQIRGLFGTSSPNLSEATDTSQSSSSKSELRRENSDSEVQLPAPKKSKSGTGQGTTSNSSLLGKSSGGASSENASGTRDGNDCGAGDGSPSSGNANPTHSSGKKQVKSERHKFTPSPSMPPVECILNRDKDSMESDSPEPNASFIFDNYFSNDERDESIAPTSPTPEDDEKDEEQSQDGVQLGNGTDQIFRCVKCGKQYTSNKSLWRHRKFACEGKQTFSCHLCGKSFSRSDNLRRHAVVAHCIQ